MYQILTQHDAPHLTALLNAYIAKGYELVPGTFTWGPNGQVAVIVRAKADAAEGPTEKEVAKARSGIAVTPASGRKRKHAQGE